MTFSKKFQSRAAVALVFTNLLSASWSEDPIPAPPPPPPPIAAAAIVPPQQDLMLNFQNTDLDLVLKFFSQATGQIFLKSDTVHGFVTVMSPARVPLTEALKILQAVLNLKGFTMVSGPGNMVRVLTEAEAAQANMNLTSGDGEDSVGDSDEMITHIIPIKFASTQDLKQQLLPMLSKDGSMITDERTNSLLVTDTAPHVRHLLRAIAKLDIRTPEVLIEAMIMEIELTDEFKLGVEWAYQGSAHTDNHAFTVNSSQNFSVASAITEGLTYGVLRDDGHVSATLQALSTDKKVNVISTPHIMALNNQPASIRVGEEVPVLSQTQNVVGGDTIRSYDYKSVAVELEVTPRINSDRDVLMKVHPLIKNILGYDAVLNAPILGTREAQTTVLVKDGQTMVIGGLITDDRESSNGKIPILGDLPLIGSLFKNTDKSKDKTELLIFLTPRVVSTTEEAKALTVLKESEVQEPTTPNRADANTHWELGLVYYKQKKYAEAIKEWDLVIQLSPDSKLKEKAQRYKEKALSKEK